MRSLISIFCILGLFSTSFASGPTFDDIEQLDRRIERGHAQAAKFTGEDTEGMSDEEIRSLVQTYALANKDWVDGPETEAREFAQILQEIGYLEGVKADMITSYVEENEARSSTLSPEEKREIMDEITHLRGKLTGYHFALYGPLPISVGANIAAFFSLHWYYGSHSVPWEKKFALIGGSVILAGVGSFIYGLIKAKRTKEKLRELESLLRESL